MEEAQTIAQFARNCDEPVADTPECMGFEVPTLEIVSAERSK